MSQPKRVAVCIGREKRKSMKLDEFIFSYQSNQLEFCAIDPNEDLSTYKEFDMIVQKVRLGHEVSEDTYNRFVAYLQKHPHTLIVDPLANVAKLKDRFYHLNAVKELKDAGTFDERITVPAFCLLNEFDGGAEENLRILNANKMKFPIIVKPAITTGTKDPHQMSVLFNANDVKNLKISQPSLAQCYVNHNAKLFKVYAVGDMCTVMERTSLRNLSVHEPETVSFHTQSVSKEGSDAKLTTLRADDPLRDIVPIADEKLFSDTIKKIQKAIGLDLIGVDLIADVAYDSLDKEYPAEKKREIRCSHFAVIDVNYFPGYSKMPGFYKAFELMVKKKLGLSDAT